MTMEKQQYVNSISRRRMNSLLTQTMVSMAMIGSALLLLESLI